MAVMTNAEKKRYLEQYRANNAEIDSLLEEMARWRARAEAMSPVYTDTPKSNFDRDPLSDAIAHILELDDRINAKIDMLIDMRQHIELSISAVTDPRLRKLLRYRYIDGLKWEDIADKMHCDIRWVFRLHGKALSKLAIESHY